MNDFFKNIEQDRLKASNGRVKSLLKWAGGKSMLLPFMSPKFLNQNMLQDGCSYVEPFAGSASVAFSLNFPRMILNDKNIKLMNFYEQAKSRPDKLFRKINKLAEKHNAATDQSKFFYEQRAIYNSLTMVEYNNGLTHASLFWYLNKTCFNGMYRETKKGDFNIPFGKRKCPLPNIEDFQSVSTILQKCTLYHKPFNFICDMVNKGDIVYLDPPYIPLSKTASFSSYLRYGFGKEEHEKLRDAMQEMANKGAYVVMSNSACDETRNIYGSLNGFGFYEVETRRFISGKVSGRGKVTELLIANKQLLTNR